MSEYTKIWQPLDVGPMSLKHRIIVSPHSQYYGDHGFPSDRHVGYYAERAKGGAAMVGVEYTSAVGYSRGGSPHNLTAWDKRAIPAWAALADAVHEHDCRLGVQLYAPGVQDSGRVEHDSWHPVYGVSRVPSPHWNEVPAVMSVEMIRGLQDDYERSAKNVAVAGADAVELHAGHGYLMSQFLSPAYNKRSDEYGGSVENRTRFTLEVAQRVREALPRSMALGVRLTWDEFLGDAGITPEASQETLALLVDARLFDYFSITCGGYHTMHWVITPMGVTHEAFLSEYGRCAKEIVGARGKVFLVGRIKSPATAEQLLADNATDAVIMLRAQIADPFLVTKTREERTDEITRCVGAMDCIRADGPLACAVNPAAGRERRWGHDTLEEAEVPRRVVVVGAGPAGLRAAATAAKRGHKVVVMEGKSEVGGHVHVLSQLPTRDDWKFLIEDLSRTLDRHGVDVRVDARADRANVLAERPDAVVVATGATWDVTGFQGTFRPDRESIPGVESDSVVGISTAAERALEDPSALGDHVVIVDDTGFYFPLGVAELLAKNGVQVTVITPHNVAGQITWDTYDGMFLFPRLRELGVTILPQRFVETITPAGAEIYDVYAPGIREQLRADTIALSLLRTPNDGLCAELFDFPSVHVIGDALAPREVAEAIYEGEKIGRAL